MIKKSKDMANLFLAAKLVGGTGGGGKNGIVKLTARVPEAVLKSGKTRVNVGFSAEAEGYEIEEYGILYGNTGTKDVSEFTIENVDGESICRLENYYGANVLDKGNGVVARGYVKVNDQYIYTGNLGGSYADLKKPVLIEKTVSANGIYTAADDNADGYSQVTVNVTPPAPVSENNVTFYDYDGAVVAAYSKADFLAISAMPANPTHEGLTAQGWNWTLADAKAYVTKYGRLNIWQMYITSDGKTRIKIKLEDGRLSPVLGLGINGYVDVDWGDGTAHGEMTGSNVSTLVQLQHVYAAAGEYTIALTVTGSIAFLGDTTYKAAILRKAGVTSATALESRAYQNAVQEVFIGTGVTSIGSYAFQNCYSLASITIPDGVTSIGSYAFQSCYSLTSITIPDGVTSIDAGAFQSCYSLTSITIPDGVTSIGGYAFYACSSLASITIPDGVTSIDAGAFQTCSSLASITIPDGVTSIDASAFQNCYSLASIKFDSSTPPTVSSSSTFAGVPTDCIIYVPQGAFAAYASATNYPDPRTYIYVEY